MLNLNQLNESLKEIWNTFISQIQAAPIYSLQGYILRLEVKFMIDI
jgi:hypothetical protein